ncbi:MAG: HAMP domain-containing histidine kinase [Opitutaceae bacterium]|nr:HAMP domain-containing histidine kinase [Opitutaceae bacterium]
MSPTSRRIFLYWLLLLVPTLVVGGGAIFLLQRERERIARQGEYAQEASRAAVATRARLVGETIELIVGDVQAGLLDALAAEPERGVDALLTRWEGANPLVRTGFRASVDGRLQRPEARTADENGRGFLRRFAAPLAERTPWSQPAAATAPAKLKRETTLSENESTPRQEASRNVALAQSARRDVQDLLRSSSSYASSAPAPAEARRIEGFADAARSANQPTAGVRNGVASAGRSAAAEADAVVGGDAQARRSKLAPAPAAPAAAMVTSAVMAKEGSADDRRGWLPLSVDGRLHVIGWVQPAGTADVRGVELNLAALVSRLGGALPVEFSEGEGYALRDEQGRVLHQAGAVSTAAAPLVRVPLAVALLPGWEVAGYLPAGATKLGGGAGFFGLSMMLVAIFVTAILAGGSLLLRQARRSEDEAAQKTSFVGNVSHEFKTPLTTIRLYAELLEQDRVRDQAQGREYLRTIGRETQRLARLVNNVLDFSRLEQGRKKYARVTVDLGAELTRLLETHTPRVAEAGLVLRREIPDTPVTVATDRDALEQIVLNLIDNACKYAAEGGEVTVALATRPGGGATVRVADRGPGVPPEHRERIFEKFHRVDDALTAEKTGAGLGLSIARQLARGLGGELRYAPRAGAGAEFVLELP